MTSNVSPEEQRALLEQAAEPAEGAPSHDVAQRDFSEPRRIASLELHELAERIDRALPAIQVAARELLGPDVLLHVGSIVESSAARLAESWRAPYSILRFRSGGQVCWVSMDCADAVAELERLVGATPQHVARALSSAEQRLLALIAHVLFDPLRELLGFEFGDLRAVNEPFDVGNWKHGEGAPDPHRLSVELVIERADGRSSMRVHVLPPAPRKRKEPDAQAPVVDHIQDLDLDIAARLGSLDMPLADILALEVGDVLPLDVPIGADVGLYVNDVPWANAALGMHAGRLAVALRSVVQAAARK